MTLFSSILAAAALLSSDGVVLSNRCGRAEVSLIGAQVVSYVPTAGAEVSTKLFGPEGVKAWAIQPSKDVEFHSYPNTNHGTCYKPAMKQIMKFIGDHK